jgi:hypothetical protein
MPPAPDELAAIERAKARLDRLHLYPVPVGTERVRILHVPWLFRLPGFRRFRGYEVGPLILTKRPLADVLDPQEPVRGGGSPSGPPYAWRARV